MDGKKVSRDVAASKHPIELMVWAHSVYEDASLCCLKQAGQCDVVDELTTIDLWFFSAL